MHEIDPEFELFDIPNVGAANWIVGGCDRDQNCPAVGNPADRQKIQEYRKRSQNVDENKGHHFFEWGKSGAFGAPIGANQALKGARKTGKGVKAGGSQGDAGEATKSRLHEIPLCRPSADARPLRWS